MSGALEHELGEEIDAKVVALTMEHRVKNVAHSSENLEFVT